MDVPDYLNADDEDFGREEEEASYIARIKKRRFGPYLINYLVKQRRAFLANSSGLLPHLRQTNA